MERQEAYDKAVAGLASQGFRPSTDGSTCQYITEGGERCAVGWLMTAEQAASLPEGNVVDVHSYLPDEVAELGGRFLTDLQKAHDGPNHLHGRLHPSDIKQALLEFGVEEGLDIPEALK